MQVMYNLHTFTFATSIKLVKIGHHKFFPLNSIQYDAKNYAANELQPHWNYKSELKLGNKLEL